MVDEIEKLAAAVRSGQRVISLSGLTSTSAKACLLSRVQTETDKHFVVVTDSNSDAEAWAADLEFFQSSIENRQSSILAVPSIETDIYSGVSPHAEGVFRSIELQVARKILALKVFTS